MLNKNNPYFMELQYITEKWDEQDKILADKKSEIITRYGWDSEELKDWYEKEKDLDRQFPLSKGTCKAWHAWRKTCRMNGEELLMDNYLCADEAEDFVDTLRKAGITSFVYANESTAVMRNIHELVNAGCTLDGLQVIVRESDYGFALEHEEIPAIRFTIGKGGERNDLE